MKGKDIFLEALLKVIHEFDPILFVCDSNFPFVLNYHIAIFEKIKENIMNN